MSIKKFNLPLKISFISLLILNYEVALGGPKYLAKVGNHLINTSGYVRASLSGLTQHSSEKKCFRADGAKAKYRLGNEDCDDYAKIGISDTYTPNGPDGVYLKGELEYSLKSPRGHSFIADELGSANIEIGNLMDSSLAIWAGRKGYGGYNVHLNDFTILKMDGRGAGIKNIDLGFGKLSYAFIRTEKKSRIKKFINNANSKKAAEHHLGRSYQYNNDIRISDIKTNKDGKLMLWFDYAKAAYIKNSLKEYPLKQGIGLGLVHEQMNFYGGFNKVFLQYGTNLMHDLSGESIRDRFEDAALYKGSHSWRLIENVLVDIDKKWALMGVLGGEINQSKKRDTNFIWITYGVRPIYYLTDKWRMALEVGHDSVYKRTQTHRNKLTKVTLSAEHVPDRGFWKTPLIRAYITQAYWPKTSRVKIDKDSFSKKGRGTICGLQAEFAW